MPRWENEEMQTVQANYIDCVDCRFNIGRPEIGECEKYRVAKPHVVFQGGKCPVKEKNKN